MKDINLAKRILDDLRDNYNKIAGDYSSKRKDLLDDETSLFLKFIKNGDRILDIGCGSGRLLQLFKNISVDYTGIDFSDNLLKETLKNYHTLKAQEAYKDLNAQFIKGDILSLRSLDFARYRTVPGFARDDVLGHFDVIFCIRVFHHIPSKELQHQALKELHRVLKPQGYLIITVWNRFRQVIKELLLLKKKPKGFFVKDLLIPWGDEALRYYYAFTLGELQKLVKDAGFEIIQAIYLKESKRVNIFSKGPTNIVIVARKP